MKICNVLNEATGKKSVLHAKLLEIFKNQKQADLYYSKVLGSDFKEAFGDWVGNYNGTTTAKTGETSDTGEPRLFKKKNTGQYYYKMLDGTKLFVDRKGLRGSFSPQEINDISKYFLYRYVAENKKRSMNEDDSSYRASDLRASIERAIEDYKIQLSEHKNEWKNHGVFRCLWPKKKIKV